MAIHDIFAQWGQSIKGICVWYLQPAMAIPVWYFHFAFAKQGQECGDLSWHGVVNGHVAWCVWRVTVCMPGVVVNGHVACSLFRPRKDQYTAFVRACAILFNTKRSTLCQCGACSLKCAS